MKSNSLWQTKEVLKGVHIQSEEVIKRACERVINNLEENDFQKCFKAWKTQVEKYIRAGDMRGAICNFINFVNVNVLK